LALDALRSTADTHANTDKLMALKMVVAEALDFPGAVSQGFDLADARLMIASALEDLAQMLLEEGKPLPRPNPDASAPNADLIELVPLKVEVGVSRL
jgi:predicted RNase H-like HicB family nuclease